MFFRECAVFYVSEIKREAPEVFATPLQKKVYETLAQNNIPFGRVDTDPGITMEDCRNIDAAIGERIVKTVFLCNRQQTVFYLYAMPADKPFITKEFGHALGISRVSFASGEKLMEIAGTEHGATTVLSACLESAKDVHIIIDRQVLENGHFCCTDGTATCFIKLDKSDLLDKFLPACGHVPTII